MLLLKEKLFNNLNLSQAVFGLFLTSNTPINYAENLIIFETYNSAINLWGANLDIRNSLLSNSGGPTIQLIDDESDAYDPLDKDNLNNDPFLFVDQFTIDNIQNWVTGQGGWFKGFGMDGIVPGLKAGINQKVIELFGKTLYKMEVGGEVVNFKLMIQSDNPVTGSNPTPQGHVFITDGEAITHSHYPTGFTDLLPPGEDAFINPLDMDFQSTLDYIEAAIIMATYGPEALNQDQSTLLQTYNTLHSSNIAEIVMKMPPLTSQVTIFLEWMTP